MSNTIIPEHIQDQIKDRYSMEATRQAAAFGYSLSQSKISEMEEENKRYKEALEKIADEEGECCQRCEGNGKLWADGKSHLPSYEGATVNCGKCGGHGRVLPDMQQIATEALNH